MLSFDLVMSYIRTIVPMIVGAIGSFLTLHDITADPTLLTAVSSACTMLLGAAYYILVRLLEKRWPALGWLLGNPTPPSYK